MRNEKWIAAVVFATVVMCMVPAFARTKDPEWRGKLPRPVYDERPELVDFSRPCWTAPAIALWYYWERQRRHCLIRTSIKSEPIN